MADTVEETVLALLARAESPVTHRALRSLAGRVLGRSVEAEEYLTAIEGLVSRGEVERRRGQGGAVELADGASVAEPAETSYWTEARLMPCLRQYLDTRLHRELNVGDDDRWFVVNTSRLGMKQWRNADFVVLRVVRFRVVPTREIRVYSFELKREADGSVRAVAQARDQTRMTHYGYLVWHLPPQSVFRVRLDEVQRECGRHGVGLIIAEDPDDVRTWKIVCDPERKSPSPDEVDDLLTRCVDRRMSESDVALLEESLHTKFEWRQAKRRSE